MNKVLVVDDEKSLRVTLCEFLRKEGFQADCAADTREAYKMIAINEYDVVITDIIMPRESGMELLANIRKGSENIQIIIMTGEPSVDTAIHTVRSGANDYLTKPINKSNLLKTVRKAVQLKALHDEKAYLEKQNKLYQENLEELIGKRTYALQVAMQGIISLLSSVVEVRDPYTAGHQRRVGNLSAAIAQKMKLSNDTVNILRIIGYVHDIGKIVIPTEILSKPGKLSYLEMEMIGNHPSHGNEMLQKVDLPVLFAETVYQHHERFDGSGYPRGLKSDEISHEARILIVADVVEAMMSHRPYRPALGIEAALTEIQQNAGILYDPEVVATCIELFRSAKYEIDDIEHRICFPI